MDARREVRCHFLASLAYRTQKAVRDAPRAVADFPPPERIRSPAELVRRMTSVTGYARTWFIGGTYRPEPLPTLADEIKRFPAMLQDNALHLEQGTPLREGMTEQRLLQGPFTDAMTHAGQLALLRRLSGSPVPPENFIVADVRSDRLGAEQPDPASPDDDWPEA